MALRLPGDRPAWTGHRRAALGPPGRRRCPPILPPRPGHAEGKARRGHHRRRTVYPRCSTNSFPPPGTMSSNTPTTRSRPTTADSNTGYGRCAAYAPTKQRRSSSRDTPSYRTYDADTTNSASASRRAHGSPPHSPNSHQRSDPSPPGMNRVDRPANATAPPGFPPIIGKRGPSAGPSMPVPSWRSAPGLDQRSPGAAPNGPVGSWYNWLRPPAPRQLASRYAVQARGRGA